MDSHRAFATAQLRTGRDADCALDEARFVDQVSRNLAAGRFLLMVVGDGITEGTQRIVENLVAQPGLAFDFALVDMAQYAWTDARDLADPESGNCVR